MPASACKYCSNNTDARSNRLYGIANFDSKTYGSGTAGATGYGYGITYTVPPPLYNPSDVAFKHDPWHKRSEGMICKTCMWNAAKKGKVGRCRRHAPTMGGYPVVYENDWCGDHKVDENKQG
jgi:hypothetical protein